MTNEREIATSYEVPEGEMRALYILSLMGPGFNKVWTTEFAVTNGEPPEIVDEPTFAAAIREDLSVVFHAFKKLLHCTGNIYPDKDNKKEWVVIRMKSSEIIIRLGRTEDDLDDNIQEYLRTLKDIHPGKANKTEWASIRATCVRALAEEKPLRRLFLLADQLDSTHPEKDNKKEWARVRSVAAAIVAQLFDLP